jgi:hypothetical protein
MGTSRWWVTGAAALVALAAAGAANADPRDARDRGAWRGDRGYGGRGYDRGDRIAFEKGYEEGLEDGRKDRDRRRRFDPARHDEYRDGDHGYRERYGPRYEYVRGFRSGYLRGYRDGFDVRRYGRTARDRYGRDDRYDRYDDRDGVIYEEPRRRY